jgi:hypothetical protein
MLQGQEREERGRRKHAHLFSSGNLTPEASLGSRYKYTTKTPGKLARTLPAMAFHSPSTSFSF